MGRRQLQAVRMKIEIEHRVRQCEAMKLVGLLGLPEQGEPAAAATRATDQVAVAVIHDAPNNALEICGGKVRLYLLLRLPIKQQDERVLHRAEGICALI